MKTPLPHRSASPKAPAGIAAQRPRIVLMDERSRAGLRRAIASTQQAEAAAAASGAYSSGGGAHRLAIVYQDADELQKLTLRALNALDQTSKTHFNLGNRIFYRNCAEHDEPGKLAVLFPGFGSPRTDLATTASALAPDVHRRLSTALARRSGEEAAALRSSVLGASLDDTLLANLAMWFLISDLGIHCDVICGHSFGEHAAIVASEIIPSLDALDPVFAEVSASISGDDLGELIAVTAAATATVAGELSKPGSDVHVALDNCPQQQIIWGPPPTLGRLERALKDQGQVVHRLDGLSLPIHTPQFPIPLERLQAVYRGIRLSPPRIPVWSASRLRLLPTEPDKLAASLSAQWREPVHFRESLIKLFDDGVRMFLEVGAGEHLSGFARDTLRGHGVLAIPTYRDRQPNMLALYVALAQLHVRGKRIDVDRLTGGSTPDSSAPPQLHHRSGGAKRLSPDAEEIGRFAPSRDERVPASLPEELLSAVQGTVAELLDGDMMEMPDSETGFFDLGLDSLACVTLVERLGERFGVTLPQTLAFDHPTCRRLTVAMQQQLAQPSPSAPVIDRAPTKASQASTPEHREPIAIVGIGCRFPGDVTSPQSFWDLLSNGRSAIRTVPEDRWNPDDYADWVLPEQRNATRFGGFLDDIDAFDAAFFGISMREAQTLDPQQRLLLEVAWEALEDACIRPASLMDSRTGVFVGISHNEYAARLSPLERLEIGGYLATGNAASTAAGRIAYFLGLNGPALAIDTACSSSLVTVHLACKSLQRGETDLALAGGVNLMLNPETTCHLANAHALSADGQCKSFDASANGYVRSEGCGVVVLKRLSDAIEQQDTIVAVVQGSAVNHDGKTSGLTVPSGTAQRELIRDCLADARTRPQDIGYIEAHGTGTALGDPIELHALADRFGGERAHPLALGSVKTNIGHLEAAAGVAGLIKAALQLFHGQLVPSLNHKQPTPRFDWSQSSLQVNTEQQPWRSQEAGRSLVSSFGISGTNAQAVLAPPPQPLPDSSEDGVPPLPLVISARSPSALATLMSQTADHLERHPNTPFAHLSRTSWSGRNSWPHRVAVIASTPIEAARQLRSRVQELARRTDPRQPRAPRLVFLFTGQGSQYAQMGKELYASFPAFRAAFDTCLELLEPKLPGPLVDVIWGSETGKLDQTQWTQPALFALEYSLAQLWRSWGIRPHAVIGHSIGEYVAACIAGALPLSDALSLVAARARLMQSVSAAGGMTSIAAPRNAVGRCIELDALGLDVAAANGPDSTVVSGPTQALAAAEAQLEAHGIHYQRLQVSHAFHSRAMEPIMEELRRHAENAQTEAPGIPIVSNLTGRYFPATPMAPSYWADQLRGTVRFEEGIALLLHDGYNLFLEIGPKPVLSALGQRSAGAENGVTWSSSLRPPSDPLETLYRAAATLYERGMNPDWSSIPGRQPGNLRARLPTYPFERSPCWVSANGPDASAPRPSAEGRTAGFVPGPELSIPGLGDAQRRFETLADLALTPELRGYGPGLGSLPAAVLLLDAFAICDQIREPRDWSLADVEISTSRGLTGGRFSLHGVITPPGTAHPKLQVYAASPGPETQPWTPALSARPIRGDLNSVSSRPSGELQSCVEAIRSKTNPVSKDRFYSTTRSYGLDYADDLQVLESLYLGEDTAAATFKRSSGRTETSSDGPALALLEACAQLIGAFHANARPGSVAEIAAIGLVTRPGQIGESLTLLLQKRHENGRLNLVAFDPLTASIALELRSVEVTETGPTHTSDAKLEIEDRLRSADPAEWDELINDFVHRIVSLVLGHDGTARIPDKTPLVSLGLDSIMATRISIELRIDLGIDVSPADIVACQDIGPLARRCVELRMQPDANKHLLDASDEFFEEGAL